MQRAAAETAERPPANLDPERVVGEYERRAARAETPCGTGTMVWRQWGSGPPILLLHGGGGSWTHWIRNIDALSGWRSVLVPDLPGFGDSSPPPLPYDCGSVAAIVAEGLARLLFPGASLDLVGFSWGAFLAAHIALARPEMARRLVLVQGNFTRSSRPEWMLSWKHLTDDADLTAVLRRNLESVMFGDPARIDALAVHVYVKDVRRAKINPWTIVRDPAVFGRVSAPLHVIAGGRDALAAGSMVRQARVLRALRPDARLHLVDDAGHWVAYEAADRFNAILRHILAASGARRSLGGEDP